MKLLKKIFFKNNYWLNVIKINNYKKKSFNSLVNYLISKFRLDMFGTQIIYRNPLKIIKNIKLIML